LNTSPMAGLADPGCPTFVDQLWALASGRSTMLAELCIGSLHGGRGCVIFPRRSISQSGAKHR
jgi:hypothetical protein